MEISKQLFEDILSGKLKGTFVVRNGDKYDSSNLRRMRRNTYIKLSQDYPYILYNGNYVFSSYTINGKNSIYSDNNYDIVDFIPDTDMKENELTIEIPDGKIVDWDESKKQNKIVLKDKQLTYDEICNKLQGKIDISLSAAPSKSGNVLVANVHQLECLLAKNMLANVAKYLNDGWKPGKTNLGFFDAWVIYATSDGGCVGWQKIVDCGDYSNVLFKSEKLAQQAIEILGEETVKLALGPLGV